VTPCADLRLSVLGGSSPGIPALLSALTRARRRGELGEVDVRLQGRNALRLERIGRYAQLCRDAEFPVRVSTRLDEALDGATHVLCMIRPGGMEGRAQDEALALRAGTPADEGIGLGGLSCYLRGRRLMKEIAEQCREQAPSALFLQMTSPLGLNVAIARQAFGAQAFGVCELPVTTASAVMDTLSAQGFDDVTRYRCLGLNHQSWLYDFRDADGEDITWDVVRAIDTEPLLGIDRDIVRDMAAIPMSYMRLYFHTSRIVESQRQRARGRGEELAAWSQRLDAAYCWGDAPDIQAVSRLLTERRMNWFEDAVVPVLAASVQTETRRMPLNLPATASVDGVRPDAIVETDCEISARGIQPIPAPPLPTGPWEITLQLLDFERAVLALRDSPSESELAEVLELHPLTRGCELRQIARELAAIEPIAARSTRGVGQFLAT
jgi:6-phospho-beta-glucosidase